MLITQWLNVSTNNPNSPTTIMPSESVAFRSESWEGRKYLLVLAPTGSTTSNVTGTVKVYGWTGGEWSEFQRLEFVDNGDGGVELPAAFSICDKVDWEWIYVMGSGLSESIRAKFVIGNR